MNLIDCFKWLYIATSNQKDCYNSLNVKNSQHCYNSVSCSDCSSCNECMFCEACSYVENCLFCKFLKGEENKPKRFYIMNKEFSKEEFFKIRNQLFGY